MRLLGELVAEAVDEPRRDLAQPVAAEEPLEVPEPPAVVDERLLGQVELLGAPPSLGEHAEGLVDRASRARPSRRSSRSSPRLKPRRHPRAPLDLLDDPLGLELRPGPIPALLVGAEGDLVVAAVRTHLRAVADGLPVRPRALDDVALGWAGHQKTCLWLSRSISIARAVAVAGVLGRFRDRWSRPHARTGPASALRVIQHIGCFCLHVLDDP